MGDFDGLVCFSFGMGSLSGGSETADVSATVDIVPLPWDQNTS